MLKLPLEAFVFGMEMLVKTIQGIQKLTDQGIEAVIDGVAQAPGDGPDNRSDLNTNATISVKDGAIRDSAETTDKEEVNMTRDYDRRDRDGERARDRDPECSDKKSQNLLRLYRYKVLFVKRDYEVAFSEQEELVTDDLRDTDFVAWKIAQFVQNLDKTAVPSKWAEKGYPSGATNGYINRLPEDDKKYLRVYHQILDTYCREPLDYEGDQLKILGEIRDAINTQTTTFGGEK